MNRTRKVERRELPSGAICYRAPYVANGKRRSRNFPTRREALEFLAGVSGELKLGVHTPSSQSPDRG
jgi:hypothetical protein